MVANTSQGLMQQEAKEAGLRIAQQLSLNSLELERIVKKIVDYAPSLVMIVGRGSSDHAGLFAKYLIEIELGIPVMHAAPSVVTLYSSSLKLPNTLVIVISQSGQSPDLLQVLEMANQQNTLSLALVNDLNSPVAKHSKMVLPLNIGEELAVAATKSFLATLSALLHLVAVWKQDSVLLQAVMDIPRLLENTVNQPPQLMTTNLEGCDHMIIIGRGFGYAIGMEVALKLKEVCAIQAECFSSAEFLHGPVRIVKSKSKIIDIGIYDEAFEAHLNQAQELRSRGAKLIPLIALDETIHARIQPLCIMQRFYLDLERIAQEMGYNPDHPDGLQKVTETL